MRPSQPTTACRNAGRKADVIDRGLKLNMDGIAEHRVPGRILNPAAAGQWIGETMAAPVRALSFSNATILRPRKLQVLGLAFISLSSKCVVLQPRTGGAQQH